MLGLLRKLDGRMPARALTIAALMAGDVDPSDIKLSDTNITFCGNASVYANPRRVIVGFKVVSCEHDHRFWTAEENTMVPMGPCVRVSGSYARVGHASVLAGLTLQQVDGFEVPCAVRVTIATVSVATWRKHVIELIATQLGI